jgi:folate-binding protein YgfZ
MNETSPLPTSDTVQPLLTHAAFAPLQDVGWLRVTGDDRVRWLNGMVTNSIQALKPGEGCYNFFLNAQGRIQGDATAWLREDAILLETSRALVGSLTTMLDHFIIMDDVELTAAGPGGAGLLLAGPAAPAMLEKLGLPGELEPMRFEVVRWEGEEMTVLRAYSPLVPRFELWSDPATLGLLSEHLKNAGLGEASGEALEHLRMLEGRPLYGTDIREKELAQETDQTRALHFTKGCYLGQEIVERVRSRGKVHRTFAGFVLTGPVPAPGTLLLAADAPERPVGELTSAAMIPLPNGPVTLALGYIRRDVLERGAEIHYAGGVAKVMALPYSMDKSS